jgi:hypothetical protein
MRLECENANSRQRGKPSLSGWLRVTDIRVVNALMAFAFRTAGAFQLMMLDMIAVFALRMAGLHSVWDPERRTVLISVDLAIVRKLEHERTVDEAKSDQSRIDIRL